MIVKALPLSVYRTSRFSDCTNGGISSKYDTLLCLCNDGFVRVDLDDPPENLVKVVERTVCGEITLCVEPYAKPTEIGWMMGGNYAACSDSRFSDLCNGMYCALAIHDRQESERLYEALSH